ncbi:flagellar hook protein FlgE [Denitrificimonas sp. JX-1]|uniref:Flagellar hook protein FlgE n=1 Tax=Denitrificimonas halotolerans TaxID=3098930 RepID=A0ABU5GRT8_9GAMM|nr:flagellar hook protein FlgE [Denitrificimonas sp. JX-1]MDY7219699.1 flagellar hook protein FlgE [Denitrificimonas sp. JX-1]
MSFSQALSGLSAAAMNLDSIGNNIANSQTVGFKSSRVQFADVYAGSKIGLGTRVSTVLQNFNDGTLETTNRNMDLGISGNGFFRFIQNDQVVYSRNGQLTMTSDGYLINAQGARLTGFPAGVMGGGNPQPLNVPADALEAKATTGVKATLNLDSRADNIDRTTVAFDPANSNTYTYANSATVFDSLGNAHNTTLYFTKVAENQWEVKQARGGEVAPETGTLNFSQNGILTSSVGVDSFTFSPGGGALDMNLALDFTGSTQFGNDFQLSSLNQDGYTSGSLVGVIIDNKGNVVGNYANEQTKILGTIVLANFRNPEGLTPMGDNVWVETSSSGQPLVDVPGTGLLGSIESGTVEMSNVELSKELVNMIIAQRTYQANAQTVKAQDEVLQTAINLR